MADWPIWNYPLQAAQIAVSDGIPAEVAYQVISSLGATVNQKDFLRLYGQAEQAVRMVGPTGDLPLDELPGRKDIQNRSTVTSTGYQYQLMVAAHHVDTGEDIEIPYSIITGDLITPGEAIEGAVVSQTLRQEEYKFEVDGARLTGIYELQPGMTADAG